MNGITKYQETSVPIFFPEGHVCCQLCPLLETYSRLQCRRTGEYLLDSKGRGFYCPLEFKEESNAYGEPEDL